MERNHEWNGSMQHLIQRIGCEPVLRTVKRFEDHTPPAASIPVVLGGEGSAKTKGEEEDNDNPISHPWVKRFATGESAMSQRASTIISQLNNYHRLSSIANKDEPRVKLKLTPPSETLQPPREEQGRHRQLTEFSTSKQPCDPPPLLLSGSNNNALAICGGSHTTSKQTLSLTSKKGVPHIYRDYSNVPDIVGVVRKKTGGVTQPFPEKLHTMLDNNDDPSIVGWLPHGRAFLVRKPAEFTNKIMPKYFRQTKLTSFQRQLNLYGFRRLTQGADSGAYYHELFLRGRPQLCLRMQRQKIKGTGHKQPADVQTEPNFYNMTPSRKCSNFERRSEQFNSYNQVRAPAPAVPLVPTVDSKPKETTHKSPCLADLSPKSRGAANLLTDMMKSTNCTKRGRCLPDPNFSIGQSAMSSTQQDSRTLSPTSSGSQSSHQGSSPTPSAISDLYVTNRCSMSLLGRVQHFPKPLKMRPTSSSIINPSFFCPPKKTIISSPSHTAVTFESSTTSSPSPTDPYLQTDMEGSKKSFTIDNRQRRRQRTESSLSVGNGVEEKRNGRLH